MILALMLSLAGATALWMTRPLWRSTVEGGQRRRAANVAAYRQRLKELEADSAAGLVDPETLRGLRAELDARLLLDAGAGESSAPATRRSWLLSAVLGLVVLALALGGYVRDGSWKLQQQIAANPAGSPQPPGSVEDMVAALAARLEKEPGDAQGWAMLGRSHFALERYVDAANAYAKANALTGGQEPLLLVNEGEALALAQNRDLAGKPQQLFEAALALDPQHAKALWYSGLAAEQAGDSALARSRWTELAKQELPDNVRALLDERLGPAPAAMAEAPATAAAPADSPGPVLRLAVKVSPALAAKIAPDATLFVFAKAASGSPMPLAVYRGMASELPREVRLDDSMAMMPAMKLSSFEQWTVTARVSRAGQPQAVSGDVQGSLTVARKDLGEAALELVLDQVVP